MQDIAQWHYTQRDGSQAGPVSTAVLMEAIASNTIPSSAMAWKQGMPAWTSITELQAIKEPPPITPAPESPSEPGEINPYLTPKTREETPATAITPDDDMDYGDMSRLPYFLRSIAYVFIGGIALIASIFLLENHSFSLIFMLIIGLVFIVIFIRLHCLRLKNIGMNPWWVILILVPLASNIMNILLLACPTGYAQTKKLDTAGIIIAVILILFTILSFFADMGEFTNFNFSSN